MIKLLKYEFLRSYKVILTICFVIILFNLVLLFSPLSVFEVLVFFLPAVILLIFSVSAFYEIGIFKKDFIDNRPNIVQLVPKSSHLVFGAKVLKAFLCLLVYYTVLLIFSFINSKAYLSSIFVFYNSFQTVPMLIIVFFNMLLLILDMVLVGFLSLLIAGKISYDKKRVFTLAFILGTLIFLSIVFLIISIELPFVYSINTYQCGILAIILVLLFTSVCLLLENRPFFTVRSIRLFLIPIACIILMFSAVQYVIYSERIIEKVDSTFINDSEITKEWKIIGRADDIAGFDPNNTEYIEKYPSLKTIDIMDGGKTNISYINWTKNTLINLKYSTLNTYTIKEIFGDKYMFVEWKDKDYVYEHIKPFYLIFEEIKS